MTFFLSIKMKNFLKITATIILGTLFTIGIAQAITVPWERPSAGKIHNLYIGDLVGIGTTSPYAKLSVEGSSALGNSALAGYFTATTTTATSTFAGGIAIETSGLIYDFTSNNVGVGLANPAYKLEVSGSASTTNLYMPVSSTTVGIIYSGTDRFIHNFGALTSDGKQANFFAGVNAGNLTMTNDLNGGSVGIGKQALTALSTGHSNNAIGYQAMFQTTTGARNQAIGLQALYNNTTGSDNVAIGQGALIANVSGIENVAVGGGSGPLVSSTGNRNIALGYAAGNNLTSGDRNIIIGYNVSFPSSTGSNQLNIGNLIFGTGIDGTGTTISAGNIGIGTTTPYAKLSVHANATDIAQPLFQVASSTAIATTTLFTINNNGNIGIGTTSPYAKLSVEGSSALGNSALAGYFTATSTTATSTFAHTVRVGTNNTNQNLLSIVAPSGNDYSSSISVGGVVNLTTTNSTGAGFILYNNQGATASGRLMALTADNPAFDQQVFLADQDGTSGAGVFNCDLATGNILECLTVTSLKTDKSTIGINGAPASLGTVKITANGVGDTASSLLSLDGSVGGYLGQGIFIKGASGNNILTLRDNNNADMLILQNAGNFGLGTTSPYARLSVVGETVASHFTATSTTATSTFSGIVQVLTRLITVVSATFTPTTEGEIGIDTTSNQFKYYSGSAVRVLVPDIDAAFVLATSTLGTGTTTIKVSGFSRATTFSKVGCVSSNSGTFVGQLGDGSASTTAVVSATGNTTTFTTLSTNNTFTAGEVMYWAIGSVSGTVTDPSCSYNRTITAD